MKQQSKQSLDNNYKRQLLTIERIYIGILGKMHVMENKAKDFVSIGHPKPNSNKGKI